MGLDLTFPEITHKSQKKSSLEKSDKEKIWYFASGRIAGDILKHSICLLPFSISSKTDGILLTASSEDLALGSIKETIKSVCYVFISLNDKEQIYF